MERNKVLHIALWVAQVLLAAAFLMAGGMKLAMTAAQYASLPGTANGPVSFGLTKFIGVAEVAGGLGMLLPALSRIKPGLTPLAAVGLFTIMLLALALHISRAEWSHLPPVLVLGALAAFVAWGRWKKAPIAPR